MTPPAAVKSSAILLRGSSSPAAYRRMFVSRNGLTLMGLLAIKPEARRQRQPKRTQPFESVLSPAITSDLEFPITGDSDLDIVPFLQFYGLDASLRQPACQ